MISYGDIGYFRLRRPVEEHSGEQDWRLGVEELAAWVGTRNDTSVKVCLQQYSANISLCFRL
jgi:hypothetical protein